MAHLQADYAVEGLDLDDGLLAVAQEQYPGLRFHRGDMLDFDLGQTYDVITCLFSAIAYVKTVDHLRQTLANFYHHLKPGGVAIVEAFIGPDLWQDRHVGMVTVDDPDLKITRINRSERSDKLVSSTFHYLVGTPDRIDHFTELHELALFSDGDYDNAFQAAGFAVQRIPNGLMRERSLFIGLRPGE
jgi:SAM-dependent methyltransferase